MEKIRSEHRNDRTYFDHTDLRIMVSNNYSDSEGWHKHNHMDQIIYVIEGILEVTSETGYEILVSGESINIPAGERHTVVEKEKETHILVIKYLSTRVDIIEDIKNDYIKG